jgi:hypothetical protein
LRNKNHITHAVQNSVALCQAKSERSEIELKDPEGGGE